uniref:Cytochrome P450 n=1 Tax=Timema genevievae TaxID=629358 RepID=A0A7R9PQG7_TIMGE|nr:unnamed protein product [Timema genevievae]
MRVDGPHTTARGPRGSRGGALQDDSSMADAGVDLQVDRVGQEGAHTQGQPAQVHQRGTGFIIEVQGPSEREVQGPLERHKVHQRGTGSIREAQGSSERYRAHQRGTGLIREVQGSLERHKFIIEIQGPSERYRAYQRGTGFIREAQGSSERYRAHHRGTGLIREGSSERYRAHYSGTGLIREVQSSLERYRVHHRGTGSIREVQGSSERYRVHQRGTGFIREVQGSSERYRVHHRGTGSIREAKGSSERYKVDQRGTGSIIEIVLKRREEINKKPFESKQNGTKDLSQRRRPLVDRIVEIADQSNNFNDEDIIQEVCTFMLAGQESVATAVTFTLFLLAKHPDVLSRVLDEVDAVLGELPNVPTLGALRKLCYTEQCIKEALRLYPSVPIVARTLSEDVPMGKVTLPKGCQVIITPYATHRIPHIYPDPEKFDPDRFLSREYARKTSVRLHSFQCRTQDMYRVQIRDAGDEDSTGRNIEEVSRDNNSRERGTSYQVPHHHQSIGRRLAAVHTQSSSGAVVRSTWHHTMKIVFAFLAILGLSFAASVPGYVGPKLLSPRLNRVISPLMSTVKSTRTLKDDFQDFIDLIPVDDIVAIALDYISNDAEVQAVLEYLQSDDFKAIVEEVNESQEAIDLYDYLYKSGIDIYTFLNKINDLLGLPHVEPKTRSLPSKRSFRDFLDKIEAVLPLDKLVALFNEKKESSPDFAAFVEKISSPEFRAFVDKMYNSEAVKKMIAKLEEYDVDVNKVVKIAQELLGWESTEAPMMLTHPGTINIGLARGAVVRSSPHVLCPTREKKKKTDDMRELDAHRQQCSETKRTNVQRALRSAWTV